ncbi:hypothetical protein RJ640_007125 [Escallonia rubra]|uniref:Uncharacterized protein n=1 Tax=Escallonia rubra TaxID=112253 RepID=A0AA88RL92_9ASTE|nr:hypothetical protein RJ640_007125 [Escallonia rubra]
MGSSVDYHTDGDKFGETRGEGMKELTRESEVLIESVSIFKEERREIANAGPYLVPESENQGVCISLASCPKSDDIVASFRPKVEMSSEMTLSQSFPTPSTSLTGHGVQGSHVLYKRLGGRRYQKLGSTCANVDDLRLPKSAILDRGNHNLLFASADDTRRELVLQELPSLRAVQHLTSPSHPIRDVKYTRVGEKELLSCLSDDMLQLFSL